MPLFNLPPSLYINGLIFYLAYYIKHIPYKFFVLLNTIVLIAFLIVLHIDKDAKESRDKRIIDMWLACYTQEEIAKEIGIAHPTVIEWTNSFVENSVGKESTKHAFEDENFKPPIYNIWKLKTKSNDVKHFGNTEAMWLENLLYLYTKPFDIVIDPFAGGGK